MMPNYTNRQQLFLHLDGISILPIIHSLQTTGITSFMIENKEFSIESISEKFKINYGYFNVCFRSLNSIGYIKIIDKKGTETSTVYSVNEELSTFFLNQADILNNIIDLIPYYVDFKKIVNNNCDFNESFNNHFNKCLHLIKQLDITDELCYYYLEGLLIGPLFANIGYFKVINNNMENNNRLDKKIFELIFNTFIYLKLITNDGELTKKGTFFFEKFTAYGVTVSYLPTFIRVDDLLYNNNFHFIWERHNSKEVHINRSLNVWGSGGTHKTYFREIDDIIIDIFNQNIHLQPKGIIDVGCGDGTFLKHIYDLITTKTARKDYLDKYPLKIIGTDINKTARIASREKLNSYNIDNIIINGNISEPEIINQKLKKNYNESLNDYLNTRSFLDHNRIYEEPKEIIYTNIYSTGAFCYKGNLITNHSLINNLIQHLKSWKHYVHKYGIIILELHTIDPDLTFNNRGNTLSCAYDTTHGFSDQYLVEYSTFIDCATLAGLNLINEKSSVLPNKDRPTISINYFK